MSDAAAIEQAIFSLLEKRQSGATICPSEVARSLAPQGEAWRAQMPRIREVASELAHRKRLVVTRHGEPVDALAGGGPIRLRFPPA